jgi:hypothetical protein
MGNIREELAKCPPYPPREGRALREEVPLEGGVLWKAEPSDD